MKVIYNSVPLADGESRNVRTASGLAPSGELGLEVLEFLRAEWAVPVARGNRVLTLPMVIELPPCEDFGTAMIQSLMYFANLPEEGPLVVEHEGYRVSSADAVCTRCKQLDELLGISNAVALQFTLGKPVSQLLVLDESGGILEDEEGNELEF